VEGTRTQTARDAILEEVAALLDASHALAPGALVAERFEIVERIGAGGMGVVYRARDAALGRDVAIKLRRDDAPGGQARLLGEARALARLSHPNVVTAHEVGKHEGAVFLAMELVEGSTLREWREQRRRSWREIVAVFRQAGAGLVAIHRAGLVYRDFKPDNVLIGADGRVRVADLGLARPMGDGDDRPARARSGTPVYMAPELWLQASADTRSDQYAFCVALHEALFGALPGDGAGELPGDVPRAIRRAVLRGLAADPAARHVSMEALLLELARDPAVRRRRAALAIGIAALAGGAAWGALAPPETETTCEAGAAVMRDGWTDAARAGSRAAFLASGRPYAAETWTRVEASLDRYAGAYDATRRRACEEPTPVAELQVACLDWRAAGMVELVGVFRKADAAVVDRAAGAVASLDPIAQCTNAAALLGAPPLPADPDARARVEAGLGRLEAVAALRRAGRYVDGAEAGRALIAEARRIGHEPLLARALVATADQAMRTGAPAEAEAMLREALPAAARGRDDRTAAQAASLLIWATGVEGTKHAEAVAMVPAAEAMAARAGGLSPAELDAVLGELAHMRGRNDEALAAHQRALRHYQKEGLVARLHAGWTNVGLALLNLRRLDEADAALSQALRLCEQNLAPTHPECARILLLQGSAAYDRRRLDACADAYRRSHEAYTASLGPGNILTAIPLRQLARLQIHRGQHREAIDALDRVLAISERALGPDHPTTAEARFFKAVALYEVGQYDEAESSFAGSAAAIEKQLGPEHPRLVMYLLGLANMGELRRKPAAVRAAAARALAIVRKVHGEDALENAAPLALLGAAARLEGRRDEAMDHLRRALDLRLARRGEQHLETAHARVDLATAMIRFGQYAAALELLERALPVIDASERSSDHGEVRLLMARAHRGLGRPRRARQLARAAQTECLSSCQAWTRTEIAAWLRRHGGR